ncbi:MAG: hypothetical protein WBB46_03480 [Candidatus Deferrimicrobiaceae bacterium]
MEDVMGQEVRKEKLADRICRVITPICNCFKVAAKQSREAEIDVPSKRRFRLGYASGDADSSLLQDQDADTGLHEVVARTQIGVRTFLACLDDAKHQVEQSRTDAEKRLSYRRLPE